MYMHTLVQMMITIIIVLKPTDTFKGERFINACYIDVSSNKQRYVIYINLVSTVTQ